MINTKLFNFHDVIIVAAIVIIWHIVANPLYDKIDARFAGTSDAE